VTLPIRVRLTAWYAALLALTVGALSGFLVWQLRSDLIEGIDEQNRIGSIELSKSLIDDAYDEAADPLEPDNGVSDFEEAAGMILSPSAAGAQLLDARGRTLARYGSVVSVEPIVSGAVRAAALSGDAQSLTLPLGASDDRYRVRVSALRIKQQTRVLVLAESLQPVDNVVGRVVSLLLLAGPGALLITSLAAYWLALKAVRPVERITTDAKEIGIDRLNERVAVPTSKDETRRLADTLNAMLDRIERGVLDKHRLLADASHDLRTPLAVMRSEIDVALAADALSQPARSVLLSVRDEVDQMTRKVDNMLTSAQVDEGRLELLTTSTDLRRLVDDSVRALQPLAGAKDVCLVPGGDRCEARVDSLRLQLVLRNLLDNAIKFSPAGAMVRIDTWRKGDEVGVTVTDHGPGISDSDSARLFDRYYRVDDPLTAHLAGSGLGLAICREVVLAHGGRLWVDHRPDGGSAFSFALPAWRSQVAPS